MIDKSHLLLHLRRGDLVLAARHVDPQGADVPKGILGIVFEQAEFHEPLTGPMVRWVTGGMCNVYIDDVEGVDMQTTMPWRLFLKEVAKETYLARVTGARYRVAVVGRRGSEGRFENTLEAAYSFVHDLLTTAGYPLERIQALFEEEPDRQYVYVHVLNEKKEGDGHDRHVLFQRLHVRPSRVSPI